MSSNTIFILLVILNLLAIHFAYRIDANDEATQPLFRKYEEGAIDNEGRLANLYDLKNTEENESNNYYFVPCHTKSSHILCKKLEHLSRRDTGFLRFGRKR